MNPLMKLPIEKQRKLYRSLMDPEGVRRMVADLRKCEKRASRLEFSLRVARQDATVIARSEDYFDQLEDNIKELRRQAELYRKLLLPGDLKEVSRELEEGT